MKSWQEIGKQEEGQRIALFPGSFDPFTIGHQSLVQRGLTMADKLVIAIGVNEHKQYSFPLEKRLTALRALYQNEPKVEVISYQELTTDLAKRIGAGFILRGIRSVIDFEYEKSIADVNRELTGIETVFLLAEPQYAHISSSVVRELLHFGKDIASFLPKGMELEYKKKTI